MWRNNMYFIENGWRLCYTSERLDKNYCEIQGWINLVQICIMHQKSSFWRGTIACTNTIALMWTRPGGFHRYGHLPSANTYILTYVLYKGRNTYILYRRQKFQNILERKLCSCFWQLLYIYLKILNMQLNMDVDSAYWVCISCRHS